MDPSRALKRRPSRPSTTSARLRAGPVYKILQLRDTSGSSGAETLPALIEAKDIGDREGVDGQCAEDSELEHAKICKTCFQRSCSCIPRHTYIVDLALGILWKK